MQDLLDLQLKTVRYNGIPEKKSGIPVYLGKILKTFISGIKYSYTVRNPNKKEQKVTRDSTKYFVFEISRKECIVRYEITNAWIHEIMNTVNYSEWCMFEKIEKRMNDCMNEMYKRLKERKLENECNLEYVNKVIIYEKMIKRKWMLEIMNKRELHLSENE